jgi:hypothetical protein
MIFTALVFIKNVNVVQWTTISIPYIYTVYVVKCVQWLALSFYDVRYTVGYTNCVCRKPTYSGRKNMIGTERYALLIQTTQEHWACSAHMESGNPGSLVWSKLTVRASAVVQYIFK